LHEEDAMTGGRSDKGADIRSNNNEGIERRDLLLGSGALLAASAVPGAALVTSVPASAQAPKMKMTTEIPAEITTPDTVATRLGTLRFFDGFPDEKTRELAYDNLDFSRGVQAFLRGVPGASIQAFLPAAMKFGGVDGNVLIFEELMDSKALGSLQTIRASTSSRGSIPPRVQS
jgi:hypothetical protein